MAERSIILSPKHGVNPSVCHCVCCGKEHSLALLGRLKGDVEAPKDIMQGLCDDCSKVIKQGGVMIIEVADGEGEKNPKNPYRTGKLVGLSKDFKERNHIESPIMYMEHTQFQSLFGNVAEFKQ